MVNRSRLQSDRLFSRLSAIAIRVVRRLFLIWRSLLVIFVGFRSSTQSTE
ncbi:MAG: hypothetical protein HC939_08745 [Pleurocapsa sp. SU_5_0]|nr:hypothetical protein [Pleurocapsa sp. SU_5_0]NJO94771.1 hypothetical protein [Pleurocapsa sp. CRU_1_2]